MNKNLFSFNLQIIIIPILIFIFSCKETTKHQLQIIFKNATNQTLIIKLFPKEKYRSGSLYQFTEDASIHRDTLFQIDPMQEMELFISNNLNNKPHLLTTQLFDSIHIRDMNNKNIIRFTSNKVIGYDENLYTHISAWDLQIREYDFPTNFQ